MFLTPSQKSCSLCWCTKRFLSAVVFLFLYGSLTPVILHMYRITQYSWIWWELYWTCCLLVSLVFSYIEKFVARVLALPAAVTFCLLMLLLLLLLLLLLVLELLDIREYGESCLEHVVKQPGIQLHRGACSMCAGSPCCSNFLPTNATAAAAASTRITWYSWIWWELSWTCCWTARHLTTWKSLEQVCQLCLPQLHCVDCCPVSRQRLTSIVYDTEQVRIYCTVLLFIGWHRGVNSHQLVVPPVKLST